MLYPPPTRIQIYDFSIDKPTEQEAQLLAAVDQLLARISVLEGNLMAVTLEYRKDLMREMRSGFDGDEFDERIRKLCRE